MNRHIRLPAGILLAGILMGPLIGCAPMSPQRDDPLIGKIYATGSSTEISYTQLLEKVVQSDVIYLGENHENADHHEIQMRIIRDLVRAGKRPQLGFEFFSVDQTGYLTAFIRKSQSRMHKVPADILEKRIRHNLGWQERRDRDWGFYFGFLMLAKEFRLTAFGADLPKGTIRSLSRDGLNGLSPVEKLLLKPTGFKDDGYRKLMFEKFKAAHCGFAMKNRQQKMYEAWIARNDTMAQSIAGMISASPDQPIVVILGSGHTEHNMGVFERVRHLRPETKQLNIGLTEVYREATPLEAYTKEVTLDGRLFPPSHEILWFTRRYSYEDPCNRFRKHLESMKKRQEH